MMQKSCPDWLKQAIDQLYNEQSAQIAKQTKFDALNQRQSQLEEKLKTRSSLWRKIGDRRFPLAILFARSVE